MLSNDSFGVPAGARSESGLGHGQFFNTVVFCWNIIPGFRREGEGDREQSFILLRSDAAYYLSSANIKTRRYRPVFITTSALFSLLVNAARASLCYE